MFHINLIHKHCTQENHFKEHCFLIYELKSLSSTYTKLTKNNLQKLFTIDFSERKTFHKLEPFRITNSMTETDCKVQWGTPTKDSGHQSS